MTATNNRSLTIGRILALAVLYFTAGRLGLLLAIPPGYATVFWPASGLALAAVYIYGYPMLAGVFLGSAVLNILNGASLTPAAALVGTMIGLGGSLQAFVGAWLLRRFIGPDTRLERLKAILGFVILGGPVSCLIAATCGAAALYLNGLVEMQGVSFVWGTWYVGDVLGVIVFSPLLVLLADGRATANRKLAVGVPMIVLFALLISFFVVMKERSNEAVHEEFVHDVDTIVHDVRYGLTASLREMQALGAFFNSSQSVESDEFRTFVSQSLLHTPGVRALGWLPRVTAAGRPAFVRQMRLNEKRADLDITELTDDGKVRPATSRDEYFPMLYAAPFSVTGAHIGLDVSTNTVRHEAMLRARDEGKAVATRRLHLLQEKDPNTFSVIVFTPIFERGVPVDTVERRRQALKGFIVGAFRLNDIMDPFVSHWRVEGTETMLMDRDDSQAEVLYNSEHVIRPSGNFSFVEKRVMPIFGRTWEMVVGRLNGYVQAHVNWSVWGMLGGGILFIGFFGVFLLYITGHTAEIEQIIAERTEDLRRARDRADAASRTKSEFLANMSHEIRTPMTGIIGMGHLLEKTEGMTEQQRHYAEAIASSAENLLQIIDDILDISKIEAGKVSIENIPFSLRQVCQDVFRLTELQARRKGIGFVLDYEESCPDLFVGDPLRIRQILFNLCSNAIKFTETGEVRVMVAAEDVTDEAASVSIAVKDTGIGIAPEHKDKIFGKFDQADNSTTRKYGGTGLGLSISRNLAQMMGSELVLDSVVGVGSVFSFVLDLSRVEESEFHRIRSEDGGMLSYEGTRALLVEDTLINQEIIVTMLEVHGIKVDVAANGLEALEKVDGNKYDIVFMDCQMPEMDGYEATRHLRLRPATAGLPIIAMTAHALKGDREKCLAAGMNDYVPKPVRESVLEAVLSRWMPPGTKTTARRPAAVQVTPDVAEGKHLDAEALEELRRVTDSRFIAMLEMYIQSAERLLDEAERSLAQENRTTLNRAAHSLKSSSGQVGALRLQKLMAQIEQEAATAPVKALVQRLVEARVEFRGVKAEIRGLD